MNVDNYIDDDDKEFLSKECIYNFDLVNQIKS